MPEKPLSEYTPQDLKDAENKGDAAALKWAENLWKREKAGFAEHGAEWEEKGMGLPHTVGLPNFIKLLKFRLKIKGGTRRRRSTRRRGSRRH